MGLDNLFIIQKKFSPYEKQIIHNKLEMDLIIEEESSNYVCSTCQEPLKKCSRNCICTVWAGAKQTTHKINFGKVIVQSLSA